MSIHSNTASDSLFAVECPDCKSYQSKVVEVKNQEDDNTAHIRRRRECLDCGTRYSTIEVPSSIIEDIIEDCSSLFNSIIQRFDKSLEYRPIKMFNKKR